MRDEIVAICVEALRESGYPDADADAIWRDPALRRAFLALLRDCRPLPVIQELIAELEAGNSRAGLRS